MAALLGPGGGKACARQWRSALIGSLRYTRVSLAGPPCRTSSIGAGGAACASASCGAERVDQCIDLKRQMWQLPQKLRENARDKGEQALRLQKAAVARGRHARRNRLSHHDLAGAASLRAPPLRAQSLKRAQAEEAEARSGARARDGGGGGGF